MMPRVYHIEGCVDMLADLREENILCMTLAWRVLC